MPLVRVAIEWCDRTTLEHEREGPEVTAVMQQRNRTKSILASIGVGAVLAAAAMTYAAVEQDMSATLSKAPSSEFGETTTKSATPSSPQVPSAAPSVLAPPAPTSEPG
jgi:hypothetical protein